MNARKETARIAKLIPSPQENPRKAEAWARKQLKEGRVQFQEVPSEAFEFYLGGCLEQRFFLSHLNEPKALAILEPLLNVEPPKPKRSSAKAKPKTLDTIFKAQGIRFGRNAKGDIVELKGLGADIWPFDVLHPIAKWVKAGSTFDILDDEAKFWRARFDGQICHYFRGKWLP